MGYIGNQIKAGSYRRLTDISGSFNGVTTTFTTSVFPGTSEYYVTAGTASQLLVSLGGVIQEPDVDYSVSTNSITFSTPPTAGLSFFGVLMGDAVTTSTPPDGSITTAKLASGLTVDLASGTVSAPSLTFDANSGLYSPGEDQVAVATNGTQRLLIDGSGQIEATSLGSAASPTWSYVGDPNTGAFSPGADTWAITTGGTERLRVDSSGRLGLGTSSPGTTLEISNGAGSSPNLNGTSGNLAITQPGLLTSLQIGGYGTAPYALWLQGQNKTGSTFPIALNPLGGNVGIGNNAPSELLQVGTTSTGGNIAITSSSSGVNGQLRLVGPDGNQKLQIYSETAAAGFYTPASTPLIFFVSNQERGRWDSAGRLLIGTSTYSGNSAFVIKGGAAQNVGLVDVRFGGSRPTGADVQVSEIRFGSTDFTSNSAYANIQCITDGASSSDADIPGRLVFSTTADGASSPTERMRIRNSGGIAMFGNEDPGLRVNSARGAGTTDRLYQGYYSATDTTNGTVSFQVFTNGNVQNTNNSYGAISDVKLKENIVDATSQWDDIKALQVRKYNFKEGQTHTQIGLIAQEVELVSPGLVTESPDRDEENNDIGTVTKSVNYSVLYMKAVKALQEAMERIETLEAEMAEVKSQLD